MPTITLISTYHAEKGRCTADALHEILVRARPNVIFLEVPPASLERVLNDEENLESRAVNVYLRAHDDARAVPVDIMEAPDDLVAAYGRLHRKCWTRSRDYAHLFNENSQRIELYGFAYLSSKYCVEYWSALDEAIEAALKEIGQQELSQTYARWNEVHEHREREMMKNIQRYAEEHPFNTGVFLLGAAHRRAIMDKPASVPVEWNFNRYEGLIDGWRAEAAAE